MIANRVNKNQPEELKATNSKNWWNGIKKIRGGSLSIKDSLAGLTNDLCGGDIKKMADMINFFFHSTSVDLPKPDKARLDPLNPNGHIPDKYIISVSDVEKQLMHLNIR